MPCDKSHGHGVSAKFAMQAPLLAPVYPPCHPERSRRVAGERSAILFDERRFFACAQNHYGLARAAQDDENACHLSTVAPAQAGVQGPGPGFLLKAGLKELDHSNSFS